MNEKYVKTSVSSDTREYQMNSSSLLDEPNNIHVKLHDSDDRINLRVLYSRINPKLINGNTYYILSRRWYSKWGTEYKTNLPNSKSIPIDNRDILDEDNKYLLSDYLPQGRFVYMEENVWSVLYDLCSLMDEQIPIKRKAIATVHDGNITFLELYPCFIQVVVENDKSNIVYFVISRNDPISLLYDECVNHFGLSIDTHNMFIWMFDNTNNTPRRIDTNDNTISSLLPMDESTTPTLSLIITFNGTIPLNDSCNDIFSKHNVNLKLSNPLNLAPPKIHTDQLNKVPGTIGLRNLGNTCYMNSAIQCLSHVPCLANYFLKNEYLLEINENNPLGAGGNLAKAYGILMKKLWQQFDNNLTSCSPNELKYTIGSFSTQFNGYSQQDSQELLVTLLDGLHEDLNRIHRKPYIELEDITNRPVDEAAKFAWNAHKARNDSIIVDNFHGQLRSTIQCPSCHTVSITFDPFVCLSLPLPTSTDVKIIVSITPLDINRNIKIFKFKTQIGCSTRSIVESLRNRVPLTHYNYFVLSQDAPFIVELSAFPNLNIELKSLTRIDLFEFDPSMKCDDNSNGGQWALIRHHVSTSNLCSNRLFPNPMLVLLPSSLNFVCNNKSPIDNMLYNIIRDRIKLFVENCIHEDSLKSIPPSTRLNSSKYSNENSSPFDINVFDRVDLFKVLKPKYQGIFESSRCSQPNGPIPTIIDVLWDEDKSNLIFSKYIPYQCEHNTDGVVDPNNGWELIPSKNGIDDQCTLQHCLEAFLTTETLSYNNSWYCSKCKSNQLASKKFDIYKLPNILIIHLKRFSFNRIMRGKITKHIVFPIEQLDMAPYVLNNFPKSKRYRLFAVSRHIGSLNGGHYTAYAKNHLNNNWYHFDDSYVSAIQDLTCLAQNAYLLMYQIMDP